jgi:hypothetical protein
MHEIDFRTPGFKNDKVNLRTTDPGLRAKGIEGFDSPGFRV